MTKNKDFKNLVRARMDATGENFTSARSALVANRDQRPDQKTQAFRAKTLRAFMPHGTLTAIPTKRKAVVVILLEILPSFDAEKTYSEKEVNAILEGFHPDFARLRRELIDYRYLDRNSHTGQYWVNPSLPERTGTVAQETLVLEAFLR